LYGCLSVRDVVWVPECAWCCMGALVCVMLYGCLSVHDIVWVPECAWCCMGAWVCLRAGCLKSRTLLCWSARARSLYNCGKVCLSLLGTWEGGKGEGWVPGVSSALQVCYGCIAAHLVVCAWSVHCRGWEVELEGFRRAKAHIFHWLL